MTPRAARPRLGRPDAAPRVGGTVALDRAATERLVRVVYLAVGVSAVVFGALSFDSFRAQVSPSAFWVALTMWLLAFGLPTLLGVLSHWAPLPVLRVIAAAEGVVFLLILADWLLFRAAPLPAGADIPWVVTFTGLPTVCVAILARPALAWGYTALVCALSGALRALTSAESTPALIGLEDALYSLLLMCVFVGVVMAARRNAARVAEAASIDRDAFAEGAARIARKQERLTIDALVHDSVISTLLMAGGGRVDAETVSQHAARTVVQFDALRTPQPATDIPCSELERRLRQLTADLVPDAAFRTGLDEDSPLPAAAVTALLGAAAEALRNSAAKAAGGGERVVARTVTLRGTADRVQVTVFDDGVGFEPMLVPAGRLGIAQSIIGRMGLVGGGGATVWSHPGKGTEVSLTWIRQ